MKQIFFLITFLYCLSVGYAQVPYSIKEQYDKLDVDRNIIPVNYLDPTISYTDCNGLSVRIGDKVSFVLSSHLKMYKTTKDMAYFVKFIK